MHPAIPARPVPPPADPTATPYFHTVVAGETIELLAFRYFGSSAAWWLIADANPTALPARPRAGHGGRDPDRRVARPRRAHEVVLMATPFLEVKFDGKNVEPLVRSVTVEDNDRLVDETTLTFDDPDGKGADLFVPDKTLTVDLGWDGEHAVLFEGVVVDRHSVAGADGKRSLTIVARDLSHRMGQNVKHGVLKPGTARGHRQAGGGTEQLDGRPREDHLRSEPAAHRQNDLQSGQRDRLPVPPASRRALRGPRVRRVQRRQVALLLRLQPQPAGGESARPARVLPRPQQADRVQVLERRRAQREAVRRERGRPGQRRGQDRAGRRRRARRPSRRRRPRRRPLPRLRRPRRASRPTRVGPARVVTDPTQVLGLRGEGRAVGNIALRAKGKVEIVGLADWAEGDWYVSKAIHTWSDTRTPDDVKAKRKRSSYETKFTATR